MYYILANFQKPVSTLRYTRVQFACIISIARPAFTPDDRRFLLHAIRYTVYGIQDIPCVCLLSKKYT